ncbi:MAG: SpoIID/LytB domain-containing protein [Elusimicrobiota bacterium]
MSCCKIARSVSFVLLILSVICPAGYAADIRIGLTYKSSLYPNSLAGLASVYVTGIQKYEIYDTATKTVIFSGNYSKRIDVSGTKVSVDTKLYTGPLVLRGYQSDPNVIVGIGTDNYHWTKFRGELKFSSNGTSLEIINVLDMEQYLYGVVPSEIGTSAPIEAAKAQAIAARTFAFGSMRKHDSLGYDLCSLVDCQAYKGYDIERSTLNSAVDLTCGLSMKYNNQTLKYVFYFSNCGGKTANTEDVWGGTALGYLRSIEDKSVGMATTYCSGATDYTWVLTMTSTALLTKLKANNNTAPASSESVISANGILVTSTDVSGRAKNVRITYASPSEIVDVTGVQFRSAIGSVDFQSTLLTGITYNSGSYTFSGKGFGHGVGMCQDGALKMAVAPYNKTYDQILKQYFTGIVISDESGPMIAHTQVSSAAYNTALTVYANVTDGTAVGSAKVYYCTNIVGTYSSVNMASLGGGRYSAIIPATAFTSKYLYYYFYAVDTGLNAAYFPATYSIAPFKITVGPSDVDAPVIVHSPVRGAAPLTAIIISAGVNDATGIGSVILFYKRDTSSVFTSQFMPKTSGSTYSTQISASEVTGNIDYYIQAKDSSDLENMKEAGTADSPYRILVSSSDTTGPVVTHTPPGNKTEGDIVIISATVTDGSGVEAVMLYYRKKGDNVYGSRAMLTSNGTVYEAPVPSDIAKYPGVEYYIIAWDITTFRNSGYYGSAVSPNTVNIISSNGTNGGSGTNNGTAAGEAKVVNTPNSSGSYSIGINAGTQASSAVSDVVIKIYDLRGRIVRMLDSTNAQLVVKNGVTTFVWDGKKDNGELVSGGVYLYQLESGDGIISGKIIIAK